MAKLFRISQTIVRVYPISITLLKHITSYIAGRLLASVSLIDTTPTQISSVVAQGPARPVTSASEHR